jgi:hypothetical protein
MDQVILHAQHLDLIYSRSSNLYELISHAPWPSIDPLKPSLRIYIDGVIGYVSILYLAS